MLPTYSCCLLVINHSSEIVQFVWFDHCLSMSRLLYFLEVSYIHTHKPYSSIYLISTKLLYVVSKEICKLHDADSWIINIDAWHQYMIVMVEKHPARYVILRFAFHTRKIAISVGVCLLHCCMTLWNTGELFKLLDIHWNFMVWEICTMLCMVLGEGKNHDYGTRALVSHVQVLGYLVKKRVHLCS